MKYERNYDMPSSSDEDNEDEEYDPLADIWLINDILCLFILIKIL